MGINVGGAYTSNHTALVLPAAYVSPPRSQSIGSLIKRYDAVNDVNLYDSNSVFHVYYDKASRDRGSTHIETITVSFIGMTYAEYELQTAAAIYAKLSEQILARFPDCIITANI